MKVPIKVWLMALGIVVPAVGNYLATRIAANEARIRAEIAYSTLQKTVQDLQDASEEHAMALAALQAREEVLESFLGQLRLPDASGVVHPIIEDPPTPPPAMRTMPRIPVDLKGAVDVYQQAQVRP